MERCAREEDAERKVAVVGSIEALLLFLVHLAPSAPCRDARGSPNASEACVRIATTMLRCSVLLLDGDELSGGNGAEPDRDGGNGALAVDAVADDSRTGDGVQNGLVARWRFDEGNGATAVDD